MTNPVSSRQFSYDKNKKSFVAEISSLGSNPFIQIYPDACDEGIVMESENTGRSARFVVADTLRSGEGEILYWKLIPTDETLRKNPRLTGHEITLFND